MRDRQIPIPSTPDRTPWNKGKLTGAKPPLRPKHVWSIRTKLQVKGRTRDLAMFNLAIDSKLRGCDVVALRAVLEAPAVVAGLDDVAVVGEAVKHGGRHFGVTEQRRISSLATSMPNLRAAA